MRVLVVEDEPLLLLTTSDMLEDLGHEVVGQASVLGSALQAARLEAIEIAVLDVNLGGDRIDDVATLLACRGIPFVFTTGYGRSGLPETFKDRPCIGKPFATEQLGEALRIAAGTTGQ